jgi:hypothetical protein
MGSETESSSIATVLRLRLKEMKKQKEEHMVSEFLFDLVIVATTLLHILLRLVTRTFRRNVLLGRP